jgi:hypothetical protein
VAELRARVSSLKAQPSAASASAQAEDVDHLRQAWSCLRAVRTPADLDLIEQIYQELDRLARLRAHQESLALLLGQAAPDGADARLLTMAPAHPIDPVPAPPRSAGAGRPRRPSMPAATGPAV